MPTSLRTGPYRLDFFSHEPNEPPHVQVVRDSDTCRFWLDPPGAAANLGFGPRELRAIERIVNEHRHALMESWYAYFGC